MPGRLKGAEAVCNDESLLWGAQEGEEREGKKRKSWKRRRPRNGEEET